MTGTAANLPEECFAFLCMGLLPIVVGKPLDWSWEGIHKGNQLVELFPVQIGICSSRGWFAQRACLFLEWISKPKFIGTGSSYELFQSGKLSLPTELSDLPIRQHSHAAGVDSGEVSAEFLDETGEQAAAVVVLDGPCGNAVNPPRTEERRRVDALHTQRIEIRDLYRAMAINARATTDDRM